MFNTLMYAKMLEEVGFSRDQAETSIKILAEIMEDKLTTKNDLRDLELRLDKKFSEVTIKMGTMLAASIAILTAIQKLI